MYPRVGKRTFDLAVSVLGLVALAVPMGIIAVLIRVTSAGPSLFRQERVGKGGKLFIVRKFRTMSAGHGDPLSVTIQGDRRITGFGRFLRRYKLDEYPQLWNVLIGQMSLVGPRPDVPGYCDRLKSDSRRVLELRPGITGPATIKYANEEELLAAQSDPVAYNDEMIFPDKVRINLEYLDGMTFLGDIRLIWNTMTAHFHRADLTHRRPS
jgi:lipopolysaccharide/colanic/teichoic acid biosynthesis glycosyltransferase